MSVIKAQIENRKIDKMVSRNSRLGPLCPQKATVGWPKRSITPLGVEASRGRSCRSLPGAEEVSDAVGEVGVPPPGCWTGTVRSW